ncbi:hypothetical protein AB0E67_08335 [Streptomyces sp. NPDC032161]|uniref:hypothetical protein n=1 Tax=unclassified Streptomyces TaxID=2593676 RepID=UPI0033D8CF3E
MSFVIDLDAAERREVQYPHGIPVKYREEQFIYPAELPAKTLDPLLSDELDLIGLLRDVVEASENPAASVVIDLIFTRPHLPRRFVEAIYDVHRILLGEEEYKRFEALNPSLPAYVRLTTGLIKVYGVDLGKSFGLGDSSKSDGETSSPTSANTTGSMPEGSGDSPEPGFLGLRRLIVLIDGLPENSRVQSAQINGWTKETKLLAQLIEEVSILAADRRRDEPTSIPRPFNPAESAPERTGARSQPQPAPKLTGHRQMLAGPRRPATAPRSSTGSRRARA